jgi:hypothetical protein
MRSSGLVVTLPFAFFIMSFFLSFSPSPLFHPPLFYMFNLPQGLWAGIDSYGLASVTAALAAAEAEASSLVATVEPLIAHAAAKVRRTLDLSRRVKTFTNARQRAY